MTSCWVTVDVSITDRRWILVSSQQALVQAIRVIAASRARGRMMGSFMLGSL